MKRVDMSSTEEVYRYLCERDPNTTVTVGSIHEHLKHWGKSHIAASLWHIRRAGGIRPLHRHKRAWIYNIEPKLRKIKMTFKPARMQGLTRVRGKGEKRRKALPPATTLLQQLSQKATKLYEAAMVLADEADALSRDILKSGLVRVEDVPETDLWRRIRELRNEEQTRRNEDSKPKSNLGKLVLGD